MAKPNYVAVRLVAGIVAGPLVLALCACIQGVHWSGWVALNALVFPGVLAASLAAHEAGHLLGARAAGLRLSRVDVGIGPRVARWKIGAVRIQLRAQPNRSATYFGGDRATHVGWRLLAAIAGGPLATAALFGLAWLVGGGLTLADAMLPARAFASRFAPVELLAFANLWLLGFNLFPRPTNDGAALLNLWLVPPDRRRDLLFAAHLLESDELAADGRIDEGRRVVERALDAHPGSWSLRCCLAVRLLDGGELERARAELAGLVETAPHARAAAIARGLLAWTLHRMRRPDDLAEADALSAAAYAALESDPWVATTRGSILVWLGRFAEALPILERAHLSHRTAQGRALSACGLAVTLVGLGRAGDAGAWFERARAEHGACPLLPETRTAVETTKTIVH